jgi:hypothetical protein
MCFCVFADRISSRKAVPEVTSTFPGPLHETIAVFQRTTKGKEARKAWPAGVSLPGQRAQRKGVKAWPYERKAWPAVAFTKFEFPFFFIINLL